MVTYLLKYSFKQAIIFVNRFIFLTDVEEKI